MHNATVTFIRLESRKGGTATRSGKGGCERTLQLFSKFQIFIGLQWKETHRPGGETWTL